VKQFLTVLSVSLHSLRFRSYESGIYSANAMYELPGIDQIQVVLFQILTPVDIKM
jgi:hypothetical protein